jgi:hypothetical protein
MATTTTDTYRRRLRAQLLTDPSATDPVDVVERITAVQAQDTRGFRLAVRSRSTGLTAADVDRRLGDRSLVVDWLNRGTLHLVRAQDHGWLHQLTAARRLSSHRRRLEQEGVSPAQAERGIEVIEAALHTEGPLTRDQLRDRLDAADVPTARQALVHVLGAASLRGVCLRGPVVGGAHAFVHADDWLGVRPELDRDEALRLLASRYLAGHGPASDRDLATWSGLPLGDVRRGLSLVDDLVTDGEGLHRLERDGSPAPDVPAPRLLGAFDPLLHGWASRADSLRGHADDGVVTSNGLFRPVALVDGRAVAIWGLSAGELTITPLPGEQLTRAVTAALAAEVVSVTDYLASVPAAGADD